MSLRRWAGGSTRAATLRDVPALDRDREGPGQDAVEAEDGGGGVAGVEECCVQLIEVFGLEAVDAVPSITGMRCRRTMDS
jgi:hypothetical protein